MLAVDRTHSTLSIPQSLRVVGLVAGSIGVLEIGLSTLAYAHIKPGFNLLATYLSDIGATPVWPQILFNAVMLIVSPLRYLVLVLLVLRLYQFGAGRTFGKTVLILGVFTTIGTIIMTAVPYTVNLSIHKLGLLRSGSPSGSDRRARMAIKNSTAQFAHSLFCLCSYLSDFLHA